MQDLYAGAGKSHSGRIRRGSPWLRASLVEAGIVRERARPIWGSVQALGGTARSQASNDSSRPHPIIVIASHLLCRHRACSDIEANYFDEKRRDYAHYRLTSRLEALGCQIMLGALPRRSISFSRQLSRLRGPNTSRRVLSEARVWKTKANTSLVEIPEGQRKGPSPRSDGA